MQTPMDCPFCGYTPRIVNKEGDKHHETYYEVVCSNNQCMTHSLREYDWSTIEKAVSSWNSIVHENFWKK